MSAVAWLLEFDGTVTPLTKARRIMWPGAAEVTFEDGKTETVHQSRVLAGDNLEEHYFESAATRRRERAAFQDLLELEGDETG